ncbi:MAG: hypothetical protein IPK60_21605 [Sandaracinaceae bacterium]|nr:hypothetical protein [Sandaracinaceae bacterium]
MNAPANPPPTVTDDEIAATSPSAMIRATAGIQIGSGVLTALTAAQVLTSVRYDGPMQFVPMAMVAFGLFGIPVGANVFRMRLWAAQAGCVISGVVALLQAALFVVNLGNGMLSCLGLVSPPFALLSFVFSFFAIGPCARATAIKARMQAAGLDLGN